MNGNSQVFPKSISEPNVAQHLFSQIVSVLCLDWYMSLLPPKVNDRTLVAPFCKFIALTFLLFSILMSKQQNK